MNTSFLVVPLTPHSFSAILGKSIAQSNANEKGPIVRKMQIDSICSTVSSPISSLPGHENSGRGSALRCLKMDIYVLIGLAHDFMLMVPAIKTEPLDVWVDMVGTNHDKVLTQ